MVRRRRKPDLVSVSELFARADPNPAATAATATPAAGTHKRQISEAVPREERPNGPETTLAAPQQQASGGCPGSPGGRYKRRHKRCATNDTARVAGPGSPNGIIEVGCLSIAFLKIDELLRIARIGQLVMPMMVIHSIASAQSQVATLHLIVHELLAFWWSQWQSRCQSHTKSETALAVLPAAKNVTCELRHPV